MTYLSTVLADNPVHYWRLADGPSFIAHDIGSSPLHLGVNVLNGLYTGIEANAGAMVSNASNGLAQLRDTFNAVTPLTLEAWFWQLESNAAEGTIFYLGDNAGVRQYALYVEGNKSAAAFVDGTVVNPAGAMAPQTWHHEVVTYDEANIRLYVDGTLVNTTAHTGHRNTNPAVWIGRTPPTNTSIFNGFEAELAYYNVALSGARVAAHFAAAGPLFAPVGGVGANTVSITTGVPTSSINQLTTVLANITSTYLNSP